MNKKILVSVSALLLTTLLTGCSNVKFDKEGIRFGSAAKVSQTKAKKASSQSSSSVKKAAIKPSKAKVKDNKKQKKAKKTKAKKKTAKKITRKKKIASWSAQKDQALNNLVNSWSQARQQQYQKYDGQTSIKTLGGPTYPEAFLRSGFVLNNQNIQLRWSPTGKNIAQYNIVAVYNDNFKGKNWHLTYLFCLHNHQPTILLEQGHNTNPIVVTRVKDAVLKKGFAKIAYN